VRLYRSRQSILRDLFDLSRLARKSTVYRLRAFLEDLRMQPQRGKIANSALRLQKIVSVSREYLRPTAPPRR
jgi:predicted Kef-type K+ transport protein